MPWALATTEGEIPLCTPQPSLLLRETFRKMVKSIVLFPDYLNNSDTGCVLGAYLTY